MRRTVSDDPVLAKRRIDQFHAQLAKRNHFQLLGVEPDTPAETVRAQYLRFAKKWQPDAFAGIDIGDRKEKLDAIAQRLNEAYEIISDPDQRAEYLIRIDREKRGLSTDVTAILQAEALVDDAMGHLRKGAFAEAKEELKKAMELNGEDPLYRVQFAWATYGTNKKSASVQDEAIGLLKKSIKEQESLPDAYQYLGQIYFDRAEYQLAVRWWKKCLEWDRQNMEAQRGIRLANSRIEKESRSGLVKFFDKLRGK
jgi:curved DNA-binding protein CbpA